MKDGALLVDEGGRILASGPFAEISRQHVGAEIQDLRPHWILPGLIDLHVHLPQYESVAMDGLELLPWLKTHIFPAEARFADADLAKSAARRFFSDLLSLGTTTAVVYSTIHPEATDAAFGVAESCGIRCAMGKMMMDQNAPEALSESTETSLEQSAELHPAVARKGRWALDVRPGAALRPHVFASPHAWRGALSEKTGAYIQTHLAENLMRSPGWGNSFPRARTTRMSIATTGC